MTRGPNVDAPSCECRTLERLSKEPSVPIEFDTKLNEYHIVGAAGEEIMIYYCPFCGGRTPDSRRDELFANITFAEMERLKSLTRHIRTSDNVLNAFGPPDLDNPTGHGVTRNDSTGRPRMTYHRQLTFAGLSDTANVHAVVDLNDQVHFSFTPKDIKANA